MKEASGEFKRFTICEARVAESKQDFIHKIKIVLKVLRETFIALKILKRGKIYKNENILNTALTENDELIAIFMATIKAARGRK